VNIILIVVHDQTELVTLPWSSSWSWSSYHHHHQLHSCFNQSIIQSINHSIACKLSCWQNIQYIWLNGNVLQLFCRYDWSSALVCSLVVTHPSSMLCYAILSLWYSAITHSSNTYTTYLSTAPPVPPPVKQVVLENIKLIRGSHHAEEELLTKTDRCLHLRLWWSDMVTVVS
jgi:hypothetical protein